jgi:hypothetical protein
MHMRSWVNQQWNNWGYNHTVNSYSSVQTFNLHKSRTPYCIELEYYELYSVPNAGWLNIDFTLCSFLRNPIATCQEKCHWVAGTTYHHRRCSKCLHSAVRHAWILLTDFGKLVAIHISECYKLLYEYYVLEPPGHVDCWHTQHFFVLPPNKNHGDLDLGSRGPQTLANTSILSIKFPKHTLQCLDSFFSCVCGVASSCIK